MPHNKSCKKRLVNAKKRNERNRQNRTMMRAKIKVYRAEIEQTACRGKGRVRDGDVQPDRHPGPQGSHAQEARRRLKSRMAAAAAK